MNFPPTRIAIPLIGSIAAGAIALAFGVQALRQEAPVAIKSATAPAVASTPASAARAHTSAALASAPAKPATEVPTPAQREKVENAKRGPTFDIARIEPTGEAVIAGRTTPRATVELLAEGKVYGQAVADQSGEFVIVPSPLPPGSYDLTLRSRQADGEEVTSQQTVAVSLKQRAEERPVAAVMKADKPAPVQPQPAAVQAKDQTVTVDAVKMEPGGQFHVAGRARPGADVKLYLNDSFVASATAAADKQFAFTINDGVKPGSYRVRLDVVDPNSSAVRASSEVAFNAPAKPVTASVQAATTTATPPAATDVTPKPEVTSAISPPEGSPSAVIVPKIATTTVARGDNLWNISRSTYGDGTRYPTIVGANRAQIRDPNLIYPGQIFVLPNK